MTFSAKRLRQIYKGEIPLTRTYVQAPDAYHRLMIFNPELKAQRCKFYSLFYEGIEQVAEDLYEVAEIMHRIRWRAELKDDWTPARGWGDCDSKVTRGIEELMKKGWDRAALRIIIGAIPGTRYIPIWHTVLSVCWKDQEDKYCAILDPRYESPLKLDVASKRLAMYYIESPEEIRPFVVIGPGINRPFWARKMVRPVKNNRSKVTLDDVFKRSLG